MRLTDKQYWEGIYQSVRSAETQAASESRAKRMLKRLLGERLLDLMSSYDDYLLWRKVFPRYLPVSCSGLSVAEIGSAPGDFLVRFAGNFGATPFGVEYTHWGADRNRSTFAANGLDPENVIEADFLSEPFQRAYSEKFDIVISRGFIEHFEDAEAIVSRHVELLRPGGLLIVLIPNLRGIYYSWTRVFNSAQLPLHNLDIMHLSRFRTLFEIQPLETLRCSYFGTFSFWLFTAPAGARWVGWFIRALLVLQRGLNFLFRFVFSGRGCETAIFSPSLLYVGRRKAR